MKSVLLLFLWWLVGWQSLQAQSQQAELQQMVYRISAQFDHNLTPPKVTLAKFVTPAFYTQKPAPRITLDIALYPMLKDSLGVAKARVAMAFILGHELVHHDLHHSGDGFSFGLRNKGLGNEKTADVWGSYYAHLAGYPIDVVTYKKTLQLVYKKYQIGDSCATCFNIKDRIRLAQKKIKGIQLHQLTEVLQGAKVFLALGKYQKASLLLEYAHNEGYKTVGIRNNLAVSYLKRYLNALPPTKRPFMYPFEFDLNSRVRAPQTPLAVDHLLDWAERLLNQIIRASRKPYNQPYLKAYINRACLSLVRHKSATAIETIEEIKTHRKPYPPTAWATLALAFAWLNQPQQAQQAFAKANKLDVSQFNRALYIKVASKSRVNFVANLQALPNYKLDELIEHLRDSLFKPIHNGLNPESEQRVFGADIANDDHLKKWVIVSTLPNESGNPPYLDVGKIKDYGTYKHWRVKTINHKRYTDMLYFFTTKPNFKNASALGIKIGDPVSKLIQKYRYPQVLSHNLYVYKSGNIMFEVQNGKIKGWTVWEIR